MKNIAPPSIANDYLVEHITVLHNSFQKLLGYSLSPEKMDSRSLAQYLYHAPFALLSHDTGSDPLFNYANAKGLELFEFNWQELINLPSRLSAEVCNQAARDKLLAQVSAQGFIEHYQGIRISKTGKRFEIRHAIIWNLTDSAGIYQGQAAYLPEWNFL
jgi:hypothetical protein